MMKRCHLAGLCLTLICLFFTGCAAKNGYDKSSPEAAIAGSEGTLGQIRNIHPIDMDGYVQKVDNFLVIFDPSASMSVPYGGITKFEIAKLTAHHLNQTIPDIRLQVGLRSFGHPVYTALVYGFTDYTKGGMDNALKFIEYSDGVSPMEHALEETSKDLRTLHGSTAVIIISDGHGLDLSPVLAVQKMKMKYGDKLCIYTILVGDDEEDRKIMDEIALESGCGFSVSADDLVSGEEMADFVKKVFLKERPFSKEVAEAVDSDGDGVPDDVDECSDTPHGARVDEHGCWDLPVVLFEYDKYDIEPAAYPSLDAIAHVMINNPEVKLQINGHSDNIGLEKYNESLSANRALAGKAYLLDKGVFPENINTKGFGYSMPRDTNETDEGRAKNRRIEFIRIRPN